jgi:UDP-N-acetyl-D-glucosamine dehydrogenase
MPFMIDTSALGNGALVDAAVLEERFRKGRSRVGIIGLGYVGLPLAQAIAASGHCVLGFDIDPSKIEALAAGRSYIRHIDGAGLAAFRAQGRFDATTDFSRLGEMDAILVCVPTPLTRQREPDLSYVAETTRQIARTLRPGQLIVLESTTYPGTVAEVMKPILEKGGLISGRDFFLAYSPEREDPGNADFATAAIPKVVGGDGPEALRMALALYDEVVQHTVPVSTIETAEAVKLTENIFRAVNIALVNELKVVFDAMGIDVWEVIEAAKTKPFGYMPFYPGPGLGGHCIPIDPFYLTWKAREFGLSTRFVELAGEVNTAMPRYVLARLGEALDQIHRRGFNGSRILVLGVAYKKNVDDVRESPALSLIELIEGRGATVDFHDPFVAQLPPMREHASLHGRRGVSWHEALTGGYDAALIATDHDGVDYAALVDAVPLVLDTRNVCHRAGLQRPHIVKA